MLSSTSLLSSTYIAQDLIKGQSGLQRSFSWKLWLLLFKAKDHGKDSRVQEGVSTHFILKTEVIYQKRRA